MRLIIFLVQEGDDDEPWVAGAWDEYSQEDNSEGYDEAVEKMETEHGAKFRIGIIEVPDTFMKDCFRPHVVKAKETP